ncbi:MAG: VOC family protein [Candidatus Lokiarchaeota archaeon]|nr:VOC family protein [Candidatus Lokiarchaeota archaeon]
MSLNSIIDFGKAKIHQLGYVFKDVEKQAKIMEHIYGIKFTLSEAPTQKFMFRGKEVETHLITGFARTLDTQIELTQWVSGDCLYKEFLEEGKEGLHHIGVYVDDLNHYVQTFKDKGIEILQSGVMGSLNLAYMDTYDSFGILIELFEILNRKRKK